MTGYTLKYGHKTVSFTVPENWRTTVLNHSQPGPLPLETALSGALENPIGTQPLREWLRACKNVLVIVPDVTRYAGMERLLPVLYEGFLKDRDVRVIFALGNHRKQAEEEKQGIISPEMYKKVDCFDHDCFDSSVLTSFGRTSTGLDVVLNRALNETDAAIVTGSINFHYLAGFGGGRKSIFPGIAGYETILGIHRKVFNPDRPGKHERARSGILEGNPMHEEIMQGIALIDTPLFLINTVVDDKKNFLNIFAGHVAAAHLEGCKWYKNHFSVQAQEKADVAIVSAGGFPKDINFIQAHKSLEHAMGAVKDNGTVIVVGECSDGLGSSDFLKWFDYGSSGEMEPHVRQSERVYFQTAYATRCKAERCNVLFVSTLERDQVSKMGLKPQETIADAIAAADDGTEKLCYIIPDGSNTLIL
jgi:lactate racemase